MRYQTAKIYSWALQKASSTRAPIWLALLFSLELFLFVPLDAVLMFFCLQDRKKIFLHILIASIASAFSGAVGYLLGHFLWDLVGPFFVPHLISLSSFDRISHHFQLYENGAVFFGSLLPFPLKALSLVAGVFHLGFASFLFYLFAARLLRFSLVGAAMALWGEKVKAFVDKHFHRLFMLLGAKVAMAFLLFWAFAR